VTVVNKLKIEDIYPNPKQPRKYFDEKSLQELADSILKDGLQEEILVRPLDGRYEIVQGERRWRAHKIAELASIKVKVKEYSDDEAFHLSVIENIHRDQFAPIEEAEAFRQYVTMGFTHEEIAKKISKSRDYVTSRLRLLKLLPVFQDWIATGKMSDGCGKQILKLEDCTRFFGPNSVNKVYDTHFERMQWKVHRDYWMKDKITVEEMKAYVDGEKFNLIFVPILLLSGHKDIAVAESCKIPITAEYECSINDLHPSRITLADIEFGKKYDLDRANEDFRPWQIEKAWEQYKQLLFDNPYTWIAPRDSDILHKEFVEKRDNSLKGETLDELTKSIKEDYAILQECASKMGYVDVWTLLEAMFPNQIDDESIVSRDTEGNDQNGQNLIN
jgi:ParB/RepB/Spo0J family partition protein